MKTKALLLVFLVSGLVFFKLPAQKTDTIVSFYSKTITAEDAKRHLTILAADWMEGRETGERGQKMAATFLADQFKAFGLKAPVKEANGNSYFQKFDLEKRTWDDVYLKVNDDKKKFLEDFYLYGDFDIPEVEQSDLVFVGYGIDDPAYSDYKNKKGKFYQEVKGKTVLLFPGEPVYDSISVITKTKQQSDWANDWRKKATTAKRLGAKHVLVIVGNNDNDFKNRLSQLKNHLKHPTLCFTHKQRESSAVFISVTLAAHLLGIENIETLEMIKEERTKAYLAGKSFDRQLYPAKFSLKVGVSKTIINTENVLGYLEGTDKKEELIVITAHYDHLGKEGDKIYYGADDDGSGTAALVELAEAFGKAYSAGYKPRRSILIMPVTAEEKGLMGSEYYTDKPIFPLKNTVANLNIDMIGRVDEFHQDNPNYVYIIGSDRLSQELHDINEEANRRSEQLTLDYRFNSFNDPNRYYFRSDHYNFAKNNIPVIFYFNGVHEDYHQPTDTVDKINFDKLVKTTRLVFYTAWELANRENRVVLTK